MIHLEVTKSAHHYQIGKYLFHKEEVRISNLQESDMIIASVESRVKIAIKLIDSKLYLLNLNSDEEVLLNNKFTGSINVLKVNDQIKTKEVDITVLNFQKEEPFKVNQFLNRNTELIMKSNPKVLELIKKVRQK